MGKVRALDYTIPEVCDNDAADLIRRLLVRYPSGIKPLNSYSEPVQTTGSLSTWATGRRAQLIT
jgi:hypothetical protein